MSDRFSRFVRRARICYRGAGQLDSLLGTICETADELERDSADDQTGKDAVEALRQAQLATNRAREALRKALEAKKLTPDTREVEFWKAGA